MGVSALLATISNLAIAVASSTALIVYDSALYIVLGFAFAGLIHEFVPAEPIIRHLGKRNFKSVLLAAILGTPVPLCSCSVLPAALALYRKGASRPAVASFLISVPETGIDSIAITYGLMGPIMAIYRPLAGVAAAMTAGALTIFLSDDEAERAARRAAAKVADELHHDHAHHDHDHGLGNDVFAATAPGRKTGERLASAVAYGYKNLFDEIAFWITLGLILSGILLGVVPHEYFYAWGFDKGVVPMLAMAALAVPVYTCASMSTPIAVGLIAAGISPGAALVFLLTGPATNLSTLVLVIRIFGKKLMAAYIMGLLAVSIAAGLLLDWLAGSAVWRSVTFGLTETDSATLAAIKTIAALMFIGLLLASARRGSFRAGWFDFRDNMARTWRVVSALRFDIHGAATQSLANLIGRDLGDRLKAIRWRRVLRRGFQAVFLVGAFTIAIYLAPQFVLLVGPGQQGLSQRFGAVVESALAPGWHLHLPPPLGRSVAVDFRNVRQLSVRGYAAPQTASALPIGDIDEVPTSPVPTTYYLTADENEVDIEAVIQYRISDSYRATFLVQAADEIVADAARQVLTALTLEMPIDAIYSTGRRTIEEAFQRNLLRRVEQLGIGYEIIAARLTYIHAPEAIHDAFRDVASANEDRTRAIFEAEGQRVVARNDAVGRSAMMLGKARVDAMTELALAKGTTAGFAALSAVHDLAPRVTEDRLRFEAIDRSLAKPPKFIDGATRASDGTDLWIERGKDPVLKYRFKE